METSNVQMGLRAVSEVNYLFRPEKLTDKIEPTKLQISFLNNIRGLEVEKDFISVVFGAKYMYQNESVLECVYAFDFNVKDLKNYVKFGENKSVTVNMIMPYLMNTALGTLRGIILAKTYGTPLYHFPLPMVNIEQLMKGMMNNTKKAN